MPTQKSPPSKQFVANMNLEKEHTLAGVATLEGTSLHTGQKVTLHLKPAPSGDRKSVG